MDWIPRLEYAFTIWELTYPQGLWTPDDEGIGGSDISAGRYPAAFRIRKDYRMRIRLRVMEEELDAARDWFEYAQQYPNVGYNFFFDKNEPTTEYLVFMCDPMLGQGKFDPPRDERLPDLFVIEHTIMRLDGADAPFDVRYYDWPTPTP